MLRMWNEKKDILNSFKFSLQILAFIIWWIKYGGGGGGGGMVE